MQKLIEYLRFGFKLMFSDHYAMICVKVDKEKLKSVHYGTACFNSDVNSIESEVFFEAASKMLLKIKNEKL